MSTAVGRSTPRRRERRTLESSLAESVEPTPAAPGPSCHATACSALHQTRTRSTAGAVPAPARAPRRAARGTPSWAPQTPAARRPPGLPRHPASTGTPAGPGRARRRWVCRWRACARAGSQWGAGEDRGRAGDKPNVKTQNPRRRIARGAIEVQAPSGVPVASWCPCRLSMGGWGG